MEVTEEKSFCGSCGAPLTPGSRFCCKCGADQRPPEQPRCPHCGHAVKPGALFCGSCGQNLSQQSAPEPEPNVCPQCGAPIEPGTRFCGACGARLNTGSFSAFSDPKAAFTKYANKLTGESGEVELKLKDLVSSVWEKHTEQEREEIFICGTAKTTPAESEISSEWPKPWLYSRVLALFGLTYLLLLFMVEVFDNDNGIPGLIFVGALAVPFSVMIFFFEVNAPRNVSIFETVTIFFIGGTMSLIATLFLFEMEFTMDQPYLAAVLIGITEEIGKLVVVAWFCRKAKIRHILTGLLIGSAVGAGFAVFESAGYAFRFLIYADWDTMKDVIYSRAALAAGGHVIWAAISGAALVMVKQGEELKSQHIFNPRFLQLFAVPVICHSLWDMPLFQNSELGQWLLLIALTVVAWVAALLLIRAGLKQISRLSAKTEAEPQTQ